MLVYPYYVYIHIRPDTGDVFYVGKGRNRRDKRHYERAYARCNRNKYWNNIVNKNQGVYEVCIIADFSDHEACISKEIELISFYGRKDLNLGSLVNMTDGGEGHLGIKTSDDLRRKRSNNASGPLHPNYGKSLSEETLKRKSEAISGERHFLYGKRLSESWRRNISDSKNRPLNPMYNRTGSLNPKSKRVVNLESGEIYESVKEAAESTGIKPGLLYQYLSGKRRNKTNLSLI